MSGTFLQRIKASTAAVFFSAVVLFVVDRRTNGNAATILWQQNGQVNRQLNLALKFTGGENRLPLISLSEMSDFPDLDDDKEVKENRMLLEDIYRPFAPDDPETFIDQKKNSGFFDAYSDVRLPSVGGEDGAGALRAEAPQLGGGPPLPPAVYPWDSHYYPPEPAVALAPVTINANGAGSTNTFNIAGPQAINVNVGYGGRADPDSLSYYYPGAGAAVAYADQFPLDEPQVEGAAEVELEAEAAAGRPPPQRVEDTADGGARMVADAALPQSPEN